MAQMTKGILVTFEKDVSEEYANEIAQLLRKIRCVADAVPMIDDDFCRSHFAKVQVANEVRAKLQELYESLYK